MTDPGKDSEQALTAAIDRYKRGLERPRPRRDRGAARADMGLRQPHRRRVGERRDVRAHIGAIFETWPDIGFATRRLYVREGLVVQNGLVKRKDVYSDSVSILRQVGLLD